MLVGVRNIFLIKCDAGTRVIIPSSGDDAIAENRCLQKSTIRESLELYSQWVDS